MNSSFSGVSHSCYITEREVDKAHLERDRLQKDIQLFGSSTRAHWRSPESPPSEGNDDQYQQRIERQLEQEVERVKRSRARVALTMDNDGGSECESL